VEILTIYTLTMKVLFNTFRGDSSTFVETPITTKTIGETSLPIEDWMEYTKAGSLYTEHSAVEDPILIAEKPQTFEDLKKRRITIYQNIYKNNNYETY
jgi:hypothetical protein